MAFISKMIRYPDENRAMGFINNGITQTGVEGVHSNPTEQTIKDTITDIHNTFINELNLIEVVEENSLDLDDIPNLNILNLANQTTMNQNQVLNYGYKKYALTDNLQEIRPIFIKLEFGMINLNINNTQNRNRFAFNINLELIDGNNNLIIFKDNICNICSRGGAPNVTIINYYNLYTESNSQFIINNDITKNEFSLYVNILPNKYVNWYGTNSTIDSNFKSSYFSFYLYRNEHYLKFIPLSKSNEFSNSTTQNSINNYNNKILYYNYNDGIKLDSNINNYIPFNENNIKIKTHNEYMTTFNMFDLIPSDNILVKANDIQLTYNDTNIQSNTFVEINDSDVLNKYFVYRPIKDFNNVYIGNTNSTFLFRVDD